MQQPPSVFGTGTIISDPDVQRKDGYMSVWFNIGVFKGRYYKPGDNVNMMYRCHMNCRTESTIPALIKKGTYIRFEGTLMHTTRRISERHIDNYYYIDLKADGTGIQIFSSIDKKSIMGLSKKEADDFLAEATEVKEPVQETIDKEKPEDAKPQEQENW